MGLPPAQVVDGSPSEGAALGVQDGGVEPASGGGGQQALASTLLAAGVLVLVWTLLRGRLRRKKRERPTRERAASRLADVRSVAARNDALDGLLVDAEALVRELATKLENKAARVEALLDRADARLAELESRESALGDAAAQEPAPDPLAAQVQELADAGFDAAEIARRTGQGAAEVRLMLAMRRTRAG